MATVSLVAGLAGCQGDGAQGGCAPYTSCGGNPTGTWTIASACQYETDQLDQPLSVPQLTASALDPMLTPPPPLPTTGGDWCSGFLSSNAGQVIAVHLDNDAPTFQSGTVTFTPAQNGGPPTYSVDIIFSSQSYTNFPRICFENSGTNPTCSALAASLNTFVQKMPADITAATWVSAYSAPKKASAGTIGIQCQDGADASCDCFYTYQVELTDTGTWQTATLGGEAVIAEQSQSYNYNGAPSSFAPATPMYASYCASGSTMTLSGYSGSSLSNATGLRSLVLHPK
jgi:hypothetical protein